MVELLLKQIDSYTLSDCLLQLNFHDDIKNYKPLTIKNIEIYDLNKNTSHTNNELYPFSIDKKKNLVDITDLIPKYAVVDMPFRIESLDIISGKNINVGDTVSLSASTINDNCSVQNTMAVSVVKDSIILYHTEDISASNYDTYSKCANYKFFWKPNSPGEYYITVTRVDDDNQHYSKTISLLVNNIETNLSITLSKEKNICVGDNIIVNAISLYDNETYQYRYSYERYGKNGINGKPLTIKDAEVYDENEELSHRSSSSYPITLIGSTKEIVEIAEEFVNHAVIYYRGYDKPNVKYRLFDGSWNANNGDPMEYNLESYGYLYKYVIDLKHTNVAYVCIKDQNGNLDNNNGRCYSVRKGYNYIVTENVGKPLELTYESNLNKVVSRNTYCNISNINATGGYEPYMYKVEIIDTDTGEIFDKSDYESSNNRTYFLKKEGKFRIDIYAKDCSGTEIVKSQNVEVVDIPIEIEKLEILSGYDINVGDTIKVRALTKNDTYYPGTLIFVSIVKDGVEFYNARLGTK